MIISTKQPYSTFPSCAVPPSPSLPSLHPLSCITTTRVPYAPPLNSHFSRDDNSAPPMQYSRHLLFPSLPPACILLPAISRALLHDRPPRDKMHTPPHSPPARASRRNARAPAAACLGHEDQRNGNAGRFSAIAPRCGGSCRRSSCIRPIGEKYKTQVHTGY